MGSMGWGHGVHLAVPKATTLLVAPLPTGRTQLVMLGVQLSLLDVGASPGEVGTPGGLAGRLCQLGLALTDPGTPHPRGTAGAGCPGSWALLRSSEARPCWALRAG